MECAYISDAAHLQCLFNYYSRNIKARFNGLTNFTIFLMNYTFSKYKL